MEFLYRVKYILASVELGLTLGFCAWQRLLAVSCKASAIWRLVDWCTVTEISKEFSACILRANFCNPEDGGNKLSECTSWHGIISQTISHFMNNLAVANLNLPPPFCFFLGGGTFAYSQKWSTNSSWLGVRLSVSVRLPMNVFTWNCILGTSWKSVEKLEIWWRLNKNVRHFICRSQCVVSLPVNSGIVRDSVPWQSFQFWWHYWHCLS